MQMKSERGEKTKYLIGTAELFSFAFSPISMEIYLGALEDISSTQLKHLLSLGIKNNSWRFMPRPGEILALQEIPKEKKIALEAKNQFDIILRCARNGRLNDQVSETSLASLRQVGGFDRIRTCDEEEIKWIRKGFEECYDLNFSKSESESIQRRISGPQSKEISGMAKGLSEKFKIGSK